jgi:hypothetical protein
MKKKLQVFVSSTFKDLQDERQAAVQAILRASHIPAGMELFIPGDETQWEIIKKWIIESDVFMLILGNRYGSINPSTGKSYVESEYDFAVENGKSHFAVYTFSEPENGDKRLIEFRNRVLSKQSEAFSNCDEIKIAILATLQGFSENRNLKGWISGADFPDTSEIKEQLKQAKTELGKLNIRNQELENENKKLKDTDEGDNFEKLIEIMKSRSYNTSVFNPPALGVPIPLGNPHFDLLEIYKRSFTYLTKRVTGYRISNDKENAIELFIFKYICPDLLVYNIVSQYQSKGAGIGYKITDTGLRLKAYLDKKELEDEKVKNVLSGSQLFETPIIKNIPRENQLFNRLKPPNMK